MSQERAETTGATRRTTHRLGTRRMRIVSWYDAKNQMWRTSAPDYPFLAFARDNATVPIGGSRRRAVHRLLARFAAHFGKDAPADP